MQRQIKFRYWDTKNKKFDTDIGGYLVGGVDLANTVPEGYEVTQFTGLTDKNGTEIYEGDILKMVSSDDKSFSDSEVIANIYENPELLK